jgi:replication factor A2
MNLLHQTTSDVYKIDDGSGEIDARHWVDKQGKDQMDTDPETSP